MTTALYEMLYLCHNMAMLFRIVAFSPIDFPPMHTVNPSTLWYSPELDAHVVCFHSERFRTKMKTYMTNLAKAAIMSSWTLASNDCHDFQPIESSQNKLFYVYLNLKEVFKPWVNFEDIRTNETDWIPKIVDFQNALEDPHVIHIYNCKKELVNYIQYTPRSPHKKNYDKFFLLGNDHYSMFIFIPKNSTVAFTMPHTHRATEIYVITSNDIHETSLSIPTHYL